MKKGHWLHYLHQLKGKKAPCVEMVLSVVFKSGVCVCVCVCVFSVYVERVKLSAKRRTCERESEREREKKIYIYIYIWREREKPRTTTGKRKVRIKIQLSETHLSERWKTLRVHLVQGQQAAACSPKLACCLFLHSPHLNVVYVFSNYWKHIKRQIIFCDVKIIWNSNFSVHK